MSVSRCVHVHVCVCVCVWGRHVKSTRCVFEIKAAVCRAALFAFNASNCATWDYSYDALSAQIMTAQFVTAAAQQR